MKSISAKMVLLVAIFSLFAAACSSTAETVTDVAEGAADVATDAAEGAADVATDAADTAADAGGEVVDAVTGDDDTDTTEMTEVTAAPCDGVIEGPVTLTLTSHSSGDAYTQTVADFNAGPGAELGITVELQDLGETSYEDFIDGAAAAGDLPDIMDMDGPFLYNRAWQGFVQPLGNCTADRDLNEFLPSILTQGTYNGELYSLGSFESGMGIWAKRSALESVGARIPTTSSDAWTADELDTILRDLADSGVTGPLDIKWQYGAGEWRSYGFAPIVQSAGGDLINRGDFQSADGALNSPEAVAAFTTFQSWATDGLIDLDAVDDTNFTEGDAVLSWVGHWMYPAYTEAVGDDLVLVPLPNFGAGSKSGTGSWNWAMSSSAVDADAAWAFIDFATQPAQVAAIAEAEGAVPSLISVLDENPSFQPGGDRFMYRENLNDTSVATPRPATAAYGTIRDTFSDVFADIVGGADVQTALDDAVAAIDEDIADNDGYNS